jgi:ketosteroid isomerase-like protein
MTGEATHTDRARAYYEAIDAGDYDRLASLLAPDFRHVRPDMTHEGRDAFVSFMRDDRPQTDTTHVVDAVLVSETGAEHVAVEGRILDSDSEELFGFVDVFGFDGERVVELRTYTD